MGTGDDTRADALRTDHHPRDAAGLTYVYPVVSRRAGGVSVGVNLNPNRACNWRCVYCQVEGLVRGSAPELDLERLERELDGFLAEALAGDWLARHAPEGARRLVDVAFSGDGEPTTSRAFDRAVGTVEAVLRRHGLAGELNVVVITNGSMAHRDEVRRGLARVGALGGEAWFKLDRATEAGRRAINDAAAPDARVEANLRAVAALCRTRIQTCVFTVDGAPPPGDEVEAWLAFLARQLADGVPLADVMLYGLARPSHQPEAPRLGRVDAEWMRALARRVEDLGLPCEVHP